MTAGMRLTGSTGYGHGVMDTDLDVVTGAFSYTGRAIAGHLLDNGRRVRTLTGHPDRPSPIAGRVDVAPYAFEDSDALTRSLEGAGTIYNTYWVRFDRATSASIERSRTRRRCSPRRVRPGSGGSST